MAEKKTITISSASAFTRCERYYGGTSGTTYDTTSGIKTAGCNNTSGSALGIQDYYLHCDIASQLPDILKAADTVVTSLTVTIYGYKQSESTIDPSVDLYVPKEVLYGTS